MGALETHKDWYNPYLGQGVYMMVLATQTGRYQTFYIGKANDIGERWNQHLNKRFLNPSEGDSIPVNSKRFLKNPVEVLNDSHNQLKQGLENRKLIMREILNQTWFCFSPVQKSEITESEILEHIEYVLQEALKQHSCIEVSGEIGDNRFRKKPKGELELCNKFGREFLEQTLPFYARFDPNSGEVQIHSDASNEVTSN